MLVDFSVEVKDLKGQCIRDGEKELRYKDVCVQALLAQSAGESLDGVQKYKHWKIAEKIEQSLGEVDLSIEDLSIIKDRVGKFFFPAVVGAVYSYLEHGKK